MAVLTKDQILALPAGPEMDAYIAQCVLHHEVVERDGIPTEITLEKDEIPVRPYSTDIAVAWTEIVERMMFMRHWHFYLNGDCYAGGRRRVGHHPEYFVAAFYASERYDQFEASAESALLAICRSVLLATC